MAIGKQGSPGGARRTGRTGRSGRIGGAPADAQTRRAVTLTWKAAHLARGGGRKVEPHLGPTYHVFRDPRLRVRVEERFPRADGPLIIEYDGAVVLRSVGLVVGYYAPGDWEQALLDLARPYDPALRERLLSTAHPALSGEEISS